MGAFLRRYEQALWAVGSLALGIVVWEAAVRAGVVTTRLLPAPSAIFRAAGGLYASGDMGANLRVSGTEFAVGVALAVAVGAPIGLAVGWSPRLDAVLGPFLAAAYATPKLALLPILIVWLGISLWSVAAAVFLSAFFPVAVNLASAVRTVDATLVRVARGFGARNPWILWTIVLPTSVPFFLAGLRLAVMGGLTSVVVGEMYASRAGLGYLVAVTGATLQVDKMFASVLILTVSGVVMIGAIEWLEHRVASWRPARSG